MLRIVMTGETAEDADLDQLMQEIRLMAWRAKSTSFDEITDLQDYHRVWLREWGSDDTLRDDRLLAAFARFRDEVRDIEDRYLKPGEN
jgi:hypothetical protein